MAKVKEKFISKYLNGKLLEAVKSLNEIEDALDPVEQQVLSEISAIREKLLSIEL